MIAESARLIALLLHVAYGPVETAYAMGGLDIVALISCENPTWNTEAVRREPRGFTSYGLGQRDAQWHNQYRGELLLHLVATVDFYRDCVTMARGITPDTMPDRVYMGDVLSRATAHYNGGTDPGDYSYRWGEIVRAKKDSLAHYLWLRLR